MFFTVTNWMQPYKIVSMPTRQIGFRFAENTIITVLQIDLAKILRIISKNLCLNRNLKSTTRLTTLQISKM